MNFFCFSFLCKYKFVIAYTNEQPLIMYKQFGIKVFWSNEAPNNKVVGDVIKATLMSLVTNFIFFLS